MYFFHILRHYIIPIILSLLVAAIIFLLFVDVSGAKSKNISRQRIDPYVLCTEGKTIVQTTDGKNSTLEIWQKKALQSDDRIRTLSSSAATLFWADGSVTRLGEKTNISLIELKQTGSWTTQVEFSLSTGKTWTNLARALDPDSYFKERFDNDQKVAAVRGTIFEINEDNNYLYTASHAVVIQDEKWKYLTSVPVGKIVQANNILKSLNTSVLDTSWEKLNTKWDTELSDARLKAIKTQLQTFQTDEFWIGKLQKYIRDLLGLAPKELPIIVDTSGSWVILSLDVKKLKAENAPELIALYEAISNLDNSEGTLNSKIQLREAILNSLPEKEAKAYQENFSRASLYDSWDALKKNLPDTAKILQSNLEKYTKDSQSSEEILQIQEALPKEKIDEFNNRMQEWKDKWYATLSDPEWFNKTFKVDQKSIMDGIKNFNDTVDSTIQDLSK